MASGHRHGVGVDTVASKLSGDFRLRCARLSCDALIAFPIGAATLAESSAG